MFIVLGLLAYFKFLTPFVPFAFLTGGFFSGLSGFIGMKIATAANARTANAAMGSLNSGLKVAFSSGAVMGFVVVGLGLLDISVWFYFLNYWYSSVKIIADEALRIQAITSAMLTFGMGASSMALFARVGGVFTPLAKDQALNANDIITVRVSPESDFLCSATCFVVMFDKNYFSIVGANKAAFAPNNDNIYYSQVINVYAGATEMPDSSWPASFASFENNSVYKVVKANFQANSNAANGGFPDYLPGGWLFQFKLKVLQNIDAGANARIWMDPRWFKTPDRSGVDGYFYKCEDGQMSTSGSSTIYNFKYDFSGADIKLPLSDVQEPQTSTITFDTAGGSTIAPITGNAGSSVTGPANPTKAGYKFKGWVPTLPGTFNASDLTVVAQWEKNEVPNSDTPAPPASTQPGETTTRDPLKPIPTIAVTEFVTDEDGSKVFVTDEAGSTIYMTTVVYETVDDTQAETDENGNPVENPDSLTDNNRTIKIVIIVLIAAAVLGGGTFAFTYLKKKK